MPTGPASRPPTRWQVIVIAFVAGGLIVWLGVSAVRHFFFH
jgi:hypothetical protein